MSQGAVYRKTVELHERLAELNVLFENKTASLADLIERTTNLRQEQQRCSAQRNKKVKLTVEEEAGGGVHAGGPSAAGGGSEEASGQHQECAGAAEGDYCFNCIVQQFQSRKNQHTQVSMRPSMRLIVSINSPQSKWPWGLSLSWTSTRKDQATHHCPPPLCHCCSLQVAEALASDAYAC